MDFFKALKLFGVAFPILIGIDFLWIGAIAKSIYKDQIGGLMRSSANIPAALLVWALIVIGAIVFVLPHAKNYGYLGQFGWGALLGLVLYGVYDFTNLAILTNWPLSISLIDLGWGILVNGILAVILVLLSQIL